MRRTVSMLIVVVLALALAGCGGGQKAAAPVPATNTPAAPPPVVAPVAGAMTGDRSANVTTTFEPFPQGEFVPADLKSAMDAGRPTVILFYDSSYTSKSNRAIVDSVRNTNGGLIDLVTYDLSRFVTTAPDGSVAVDPALADTPAAKQAVQLAKALGVTSVPFVVITDAQGYITWKYRGLLDSAFFEREVQRAVR